VCAPRRPGGAASRREGTPHGRPVAPPAFGVRVPPSCAAPFAGASPTPPLWQGVLGLAVGCIEGRGCLAEGREVPQRVGHIRAHRRDGTAAGPVAVRQAADQRPRHAVPHGPEPYGAGGVGRGQPTAGAEDCPTEAVPEDPQPRMADVRWEAIAGQDAPPWGVGEPLQAGGSGARAGAPCGGAREQRRDRPRGDGHPAVAQGRMALGQATVRCSAAGPDARNAIEAQRRRGDGQPALGFGAGGAVDRRPGTRATAPDWQGERHHGVQGRARTIVRRGGPQRLTAERAMPPKRLEGVGGGGGRTRRRTGHGEAFPVRSSPW
jgi:hypothetical protein